MKVQTDPMQRLLWVDIETTGLDVDNEVLLEVGFRLTDMELKTIDAISELVWTDASNRCIEKAIPLVKEMHEKNELFDQALQYGVDLDEVEFTIGEWFTKLGLGREDPLCGSSVQFDRGWLTALMPNQMNRLSYRNIDISSVKELCRRYNPVLYSKLDDDTNPRKIHRVDPDLDDTIAEAAFYINNFLWLP